MERPLIILGAGASRDYAHPDIFAPSQRVNFPITDELLDGNFIDSDIEKHLTDFVTLRSRLIACTKRKGNSFEKCLEGWTDHGQLSGLRLYLGDYFWARSGTGFAKEGATNFRALIDLIKHSPAKGAYVVTFNYDVLLENALGIDRFFSLSNYIDGSVDNIKIIKIHGSCDWYDLLGRTASDKLAALKQHPDFFARPSRQILTRRWLNQRDSGAHQFWLIPVIALPTTTTKSYACPHDHIQLLTSALADIQKILIIGWKAGDSFLLEKLKEIKQPVDLTVVSGTLEGAEKVAKVIEKYVDLKGKTLSATFSDFIGSPECSRFFNN